MKKVMSFAIVLMLAFSCVFTAFAQTDDTATPDEAKKVTELKITKLPDKLTYTAEDVIDPDIDLSKIADEDATEESLIKYFSQFNFELKLDLTGIEVKAVTVTVQPKRLMLRTAKLSLLIRLITAKQLRHCLNMRKICLILQKI